MAEEAVKAGRSPTTSLEDNSLIAFMLYKGHKINAWRCCEDPIRIAFDIEGDSGKIEKDMQAYFDNEAVGIQDYVKCFKEVKSRQYSLKKVIR